MPTQPRPRSKSDPSSQSKPTPKTIVPRPEPKNEPPLRKPFRGEVQPRTKTTWDDRLSIEPLTQMQPRVHLRAPGAASNEAPRHSTGQLCQRDQQSSTPMSSLPARRLTLNVVISAAESTLRPNVCPVLSQPVAAMKNKTPRTMMICARFASLRSLEKSPASSCQAAGTFSMPNASRIC